MERKFKQKKKSSFHSLFFVSHTPPAISSYPVFLNKAIFFIRKGRSEEMRSMEKVQTDAMNRFQDLVTRVEGSGKQTAEIFLFALSTCMWCSLGKKWLREKGYRYSYLDVDRIPLKEKNRIKKELAQITGEQPGFPFLIIDRKKWHSGYEPSIWEEMLNE
jgi:glutaredoxin-like protein NrdH